jgi:hypothetical protein
VASGERRPDKIGDTGMLNLLPSLVIAALDPVQCVHVDIIDTVRRNMCGSLSLDPTGFFELRSQIFSPVA